MQPIMTEFDYVTQYPGKYPEKAVEDIRKYIADNDRIKNRGPVDTSLILNNCIPEDYPGYFGKCELCDDVARYMEEKLQVNNRVFYDRDYAISMGYEGIPVHHPVAMFYAIGPFPVSARDRFTACNISHRCQLHKTIYTHDTLYYFIDENTFQDCTPDEGAEARTIALTQKASVFNQKGELVASVTYNICELLRVMENQEAAKKGFEEHGFVFCWAAPNWWERERHYYTDEDWDWIRSVWSNETQRGAEPLYWEDVKVGDIPTPTLEGPIDDTGGWPNPNFGLILGGSRTLRNEIMDPEIFKTMVRNPYDGIWRMKDRNYSLTIPPERLVAPYMGDQEFPPKFPNNDPLCEPFWRDHFVNHCGRDFVFRHIYNWCGEHGFITDWHWAIMSPESLRKYGMDFKPHPNYEPICGLHCDLHSELKDLHVTEHGVEGDIAYIQSRVADKYIRDGEHYVKLAWWIEEITGGIWEEGWTEVRLPSKNSNL